MNLIDAVKTLKPAERFKALIFIGVLTAGTTLLTVWLKGNPCEKISEQYSKMLKNYSDVAAANNQLMASDNQKQAVIIQLRDILQKMDSLGGVTQTVVVDIPSRTNEIRAIRKTDQGMGGTGDSGEGAIARAEVVQEQQIQQPTKKIVKFVSNMTKDQRSLLDSALNITKNQK